MGFEIDDASPVIKKTVIMFKVILLSGETKYFTRAMEAIDYANIYGGRFVSE